MDLLSQSTEEVDPKVDRVFKALTHLGDALTHLVVHLQNVCLELKNKES